MVDKIHIKNFKSVYDLELDLGRFNVFIGENGSGKSNILEAVALGSAASANLLVNEFLASRGIRTSESHLMFSAFSKKSNRTCRLEFLIDNSNYTYKLANKKKGASFEEQNRIEIVKVLQRSLKEMLGEKAQPSSENNKSELKKDSTLVAFFALLNDYPDINPQLAKSEMERFALEKVLKEAFSNQLLIDYLIFSPENNSLRNFFDERQISPVGLKGEGLFKELKRISLKKSKRQFSEINEQLNGLLDWFEKFEVPSNGFPGEQYLKIKDKYLSESVEFIDQRSANEGFLFLLFFLTLFISEDTPAFFAIDNIENSFNPKLCSKLSQVLVTLAKAHKKQALVTTHNPFILDGLDLEDDEQRLFVVRRNLDGHTIATRIKPDKPLSYKLSEAWMNGYIGGLPNNF